MNNIFELLSDEYTEPNIKVNKYNLLKKDVTSNKNMSKNEKKKDQSINVQNENNTIQQKEILRNNQRKLLCNNRLKKCSYGNKCMYAHTYEEQHIEPDRKIVYDIIMNLHHNKDPIDITKNGMIKTFLTLTNVCSGCINNTCPGGYNCKYGVFDKKYQICINDLTTGKCDNIHCTLVHVTKYGIIPINKTALLANKNTNFINNIKRNNENSYDNINKSNEKIINILINHNENIDDNTIDNDIDIEKYLNEKDSDDEYERSIFTL